MNDYPEGYADSGDEGLPPWLRHDAVIAAVVGAWEQEEQDRRHHAAALLLQRVHRCEKRRGWLADPPVLVTVTGAKLRAAQEQGWLA